MKEGLLKKISLICGIIIAISTIVGLVIKSNYRPVLAGEHYQLEQRVDNFITTDRIDQLQQRIWKLEDRYIDREQPSEVRDEIRELEKEKESLEIYLREKTK